MKRHLLVLTFALLVAVCSPSSASGVHIDLGFDAGRAYSIKDGAFVPSTVPSVSMLFGPVTVSSATYFHGSSFYESWTQAEWYSREGATGKFTFFAYGNYDHWTSGSLLPAGGSWAAQAGVRYRIR